MCSQNRFHLVFAIALAAGMLAAAGGIARAQSDQPAPSEEPGDNAAPRDNAAPPDDAEARDEPDRAAPRAKADPGTPEELMRTAEDFLNGALLELAPKPLLKRGPYRVLWAQWLGLPLILLAAWALGSLLSRVSRSAFRPIVRRTITHWDDAFVNRMGAPITLAWTLIATFFLLPLLGLRPVALTFAFQVMRAGWVMCLFWALARAVDVGSQVILASTYGPGSSARRALLPLATRVAKMMVIVFAIVALISELGYSVASIVAGLGVGGLAVALAAQKTFEHWFGAFAIAVDQPFREGDFVRIDNLSGTVEQIGMRSTRVRTLERTIVSIPNGKLAEMQPETFAAKDRSRLAVDLRLVYGTTSAQVREILAGLVGVLQTQPKLRKDSESVVLRELAPTALVIEVIAFFETLDADEFNQIRQDSLLAFMEVIENAGSQLALPAQRIEFANKHDAANAERETTGVMSGIRS
jgi:MscS family membrane protein